MLGESEIRGLELMRNEGPEVVVRGLDCLDGTPLLDLQPDRAGFTPLVGELRTRREWTCVTSLR